MAEASVVMWLVSYVIVIFESPRVVVVHALLVYATCILYTVAVRCYTMTTCQYNDDACKQQTMKETLITRRCVEAVRLHCELVILGILWCAVPPYMCALCSGRQGGRAPLASDSMDTTALAMLSKGTTLATKR